MRGAPYFLIADIIEIKKFSPCLLKIVSRFAASPRGEAVNNVD